MKSSLIIAAAIVITGLGSCSSTKITSSWKAENLKPTSYHNIMVWGLLAEKDSSVRLLIETHLVNDLVSKGYHAVSSLDVYKAKAYKKLTSAEVLNEFKSTGIDAVITMVLLDKEKEKKYYPEGYQTTPANIYGNLDRYYSTIYEKVFSPGYYITTTTYFWESSLFQLPDAAMVYTVRTSSFDPFTTEMLAHENGQAIIKDMLKKKIILDIAPPTDQ